MALFWRIWAAVLTVNLVVLTLFVGLATLQFDSINANLVGERLAVLAGRTAAPFRASAKIGLPLSAVRNARALLERARQTDDAISAIHAFDPEGRVIFSTAQPPPATIPDEAGTARTRASGASWHLHTGSSFLGGIDIAGADGRSAGGILIVYPDDGNVTQVRAMAAELAMAAIAVLAVVSILGCGLLRLSLRGPLATSEAIESAIADFERWSWRSAASTEQAVYQSDAATDLHHLLNEAEARYREIGTKLEKTS